MYGGWRREVLGYLQLGWLLLNAAGKVADMWTADLGLRAEGWW